MKNKILIIYLLILFVASFLRLYQLSDVPPGVNRDEASIGYTAYSLLLTGKDEYGRPFPVSFQSFGDWKLPLYIYTTVISVKIFGLSEIAVRLPSSIFGIATVGLTYWLIKELFGNHRNKQNFTQNYTEKIALLTTFLLAISPWHLHMSRVESESNTAVFLIVLGLLFFLKGVRKTQWFLIPSFILFSLTYYTYAGNHIFTTLFVIGLIVIYIKEIPRTKITYLSFLIFACLSSFILYNTIFVADKTKISGISIFGDPAVVHSKIELSLKDHLNSLNIVSKAFHNKVFYALEKVSQNYLSSYSPQFLFIKGGDNSAHNIPDFGNMYLVESPFFLFGIIYIFTLKKSREKYLILWWLLIAPVAASITKDAPHSNRMFAVFPMLSLVTAFGLIWFISLFDKYKAFIIGIISCLFLLNFFVYLDRYYVHFPNNKAYDWGYGYKKLNSILSQKKYEGEKVIIPKPETSPYIFLLFYSKYDPKKYQQNVVRYPVTSDGFVDVKSFDKFEFRKIDWSKDIDVLGRILIDEPFFISDFTKKQNYPTEKVILPNSNIIFYVININKKKTFE